MEIGNIIKGHVSNALGLNEDISLKRLKICYKCPLYNKDKYGGQCNNKLWLNPENGDASSVKKDGYIQGCGCALNAKTRLNNAKCPANKW